MTRVMVCEDDLVLALDLAAQVEEAGGEVVGIFYSSSEAWKAARLLKPDIAIIDLKLSDGESGFALANNLAAQGCRVIVVSGSTALHPELGLIPHLYVSKPVPEGVIAELIGLQ